MALVSPPYTIFDSNDVQTRSTLPDNPAIDQLISYTGVSPTELIRWTGKGSNPTLRRYSASKEATINKIEDLDESSDRSLDVTVKTVAKQTVTTESQNISPFASSAKWELHNGAYQDGDGYIILPDATSYARVVVYWGKRSRYIAFGAAFYSANTGAIFHATLDYLDANQTSIVANGYANYLGKIGSDTWEHAAFGDAGAEDIYANGRGSCIYVALTFMRSDIATQPYRFVAPYLSTVDSAVPITFVPQSPSPWYPAPITPTIAAGANANTYRRGTNLFDKHDFVVNAVTVNGATKTETDTGVKITSGGSVYAYAAQEVSFPPGTVMTIQRKMPVVTGAGVGLVGVYNSDYSESLGFIQGYEGVNHLTFTVPSNGKFIIVLYCTVETAGVGTAEFDDIQLAFEQSRSPDYAPYLAPLSYEPYSGNEYTMPVQQAMYGVTGTEDERGTDGRETHKTALLTLTGVEGWTDNSAFAANGHHTFYTIVPTLGAVTHAPVSSHFPTRFANTSEDTSGVAAEAGGAIALRVPDAIATTPAALQAWVLDQYNAGTPVQIVYQLASPITLTNAATPISGVNGTNTIFSNGSKVTVGYTGSGWLPVGDPKQIKIENVRITQEEGIRIDTVLMDGTNSVAVYFRACGTQVGLYRVSDNKQLWGGRLLPDGRVVTVTGALIDPNGDGSSWVEFVEGTEGSEIWIVNPTYEGIGTRVDGDNPDPSGTLAALVLNAWTRPYWDETAVGYKDNTITHIKTTGSLWLEAYDTINLFGSNGTTIDGKRIESGDIAFTVPANSQVNVSITFAKPFLTNPTIVQSINSVGNTNGSSTLDIWRTATSPTGATFRINNGQGYSRSGFIDWIASGL